MPTYAVLGATGKTGQALLTILSQKKDNEIRAYVRSKAKLLALSPELASASSSNVRIFEGPLHDVNLLGQCMQGTKAVFLVVAVSDNVPGCKIAQETAHVVIAALEQLRSKDPDTKMPRLVVLSAAPTEPNLCRDMPRLVGHLLFAAFSNIYTDLIKAEEYLRSQEDLVKSTFIKPGGLARDIQRGHALSTEKQRSFLSFLDLAAGMVEVAESEGTTWDMKSVSVLPTSKQVKFEKIAPVYLLKGLLFHFLPWLYH